VAIAGQSGRITNGTNLQREYRPPERRDSLRGPAASFLVAEDVLSRLLIGVPARNEAKNIVEVAQRIESGAKMLASSFDCRLALAYQTSDDDTLDRFTTRFGEMPQVVLQAPEPAVGKGANVKLLIRHAREVNADFLLLVDADFGDYDPCNVARTVDAADRHRHALVLPLWCRPRGQGNTTNYLASPLLLATHSARIRQPLAGHMLIHRSLFEQLDLDALPDDFGIDIMITLTALAAGVSIGQIPLVAPEHPSKAGNSERVMVEVTTAVLPALAALPAIGRPDVRLPDRYWDGWEWPPGGGAEPDHVDVILRQARSEAQLESWLRLAAADDDDVAETWCDHLAAAVRRIRAPHPDLGRIVDDLVCPFFAHAEHRARRGASVAELEQYVAELGHRLAMRLHA